MEKIEYRVRPVTRFIVTRFEEGECSVGSSQLGEYDNEHVAYEVGYALCRAEHERLGWPPGDERIRYPAPIPETDVASEPIGSGGIAQSL